MRCDCEARVPVIVVETRVPISATAAEMRKGLSAVMMIGDPHEKRITGGQMNGHVFRTHHYTFNESSSKELQTHYRQIDGWTDGWPDLRTDTPLIKMQFLTILR